MALVAAADRMLYQAKADGRNRIAIDLPSGFLDNGPNAVNKDFIKFIWHESYYSGNDQIDAQHRELFRQANRLISDQLSGSPKLMLARSVETLIKEVAIHFKDEELIQESVSYPNRMEHSRAHAQLMKRALELKVAFDNDSLSGGDLFEFLAHEVIVKHMLEADRDYFTYLTSNI